MGERKEVLQKQVHDHTGHSHGVDAEGIVDALKGQGNRGALVTLLGLLTNILLTVIKGLAGWYLNSAVLVADAGHSLSDLMGDLVTLFFYTISRRPASIAYPYGFGKFESLGTSTVAIFLLLGAWAIGAHSYTQLEEAIPSIREHLPWLSGVFASFGESEAHTNLDESELDPNAAWIAILSIIIKEGMYRLSSSVARAENSPVLLANALHHRSDMYSSFVSLVAILGNWYMPSLPLDPIGGLLVTVLILHQAFELLSGSLFELTDHSLESDSLEEIATLISNSISSSAFAPNLTAKPTDVRGIRRGAHLFIEATIDVPGSQNITLREAVSLEDGVTRNVRAVRNEVKDIRLRFAPIDL